MVDKPKTRTKRMLKNQLSNIYSDGENMSVSDSSNEVTFKTPKEGVAPDN